MAFWQVRPFLLVLNQLERFLRNKISNQSPSTSNYQTSSPLSPFILTSPFVTSLSN